MDHAAVLEEGQVIQVISLNQNGLKPWDCGLWSENPPAALRDSFRDPQSYLQAICRINEVHRKKVRFRSDRAQALLNVYMVTVAIVGTIAGLMLIVQQGNSVTVVSIVIALFLLYSKIFTLRKQEAKRILRLLQKVVGGANTLLWEEDVLIGCVSNAALLIVRVPLSACREHLGRRFDSVLNKYSCGYVCCLAQRQANSSPPPEEPGHLQGGPCFCQHVLEQSGCFC